MKILGWLHRKLRRDPLPGDPYMDFADGGHSCGCLQSQPSPKELHPSCQHNARLLQRTPLLSVEKGKPPPTAELLFQGLLAIGTLGSEPSLDGLPLQQLQHLFDSITTTAEKEPLEVTESDVKGINAELEKALAPNPGDKNDQLLSSAPPGTDVDLSPTELFTTSCQTADQERGGGGKKGQKGKKAAAAMHLMVRKMLRQRGSNMGAAARGGAEAAARPVGGRPGHSATAETKIYFYNKLLHFFHKKVHPEGSVVQKKHAKPHSRDTHIGASSSVNNTHVGASGGDDVGHSGSGGSAMALSTRALEGDDATCCFKNWSHLLAPQGPSSLCGAESNGNREYWIKTDADCKCSSLDKQDLHGMT